MLQLGDSVAHRVDPDITVRELKETCGLVAAIVRFRGKPLKNGDVLSACGVAADSEMHAFPPNRDTVDAKYHAARRLDRGATKRSTAH